MENQTGNQNIQSWLKTALESIREMIDVNIIIGDAVTTAQGTTIIPISKVSFGFAAGGAGNLQLTDNKADGFGSGAGVSIKPVGFLVCNNEHVHFLSIDNNSLGEQLLENMPQLINNLQKLFQRQKNNDESVSINRKDFD